MLSSISFYNFEINCERFSFSTQPRIYTFGYISQKPVIFAQKIQHNASIYNFQHNHIIIRSVTFQRILRFSTRRINIMHQWTIIFDVTNFMTIKIRENMFSLFNRILLSLSLGLPTKIQTGFLRMLNQRHAIRMKDLFSNLFPYSVYVKKF